MISIKRFVNNPLAFRLASLCLCGLAVASICALFTSAWCNDWALFPWHISVLTPLCICGAIAGFSVAKFLSAMGAIGRYLAAFSCSYLAGTLILPFLRATFHLEGNEFYYGLPSLLSGVVVVALLAWLGKSKSRLNLVGCIGGLALSGIIAGTIMDIVRVALSMYCPSAISWWPSRPLMFACFGFAGGLTSIVAMQLLGTARVFTKWFITLACSTIPAILYVSNSQIPFHGRVGDLVILLLVFGTAGLLGALAAVLMVLCVNRLGTVSMQSSVP